MVPVGKNMLSKMVPDMCIEAGLTRKTNHSLRVSGTSCLFEAGVPERLIQVSNPYECMNEPLKNNRWLLVKSYQERKVVES